MKPSIALPLGVAAILAGIGTAIASANGQFAKHPSLAYWFYGPSLALLLIAVTGWIVSVRQDHKGPPKVRDWVGEWRHCEELFKKWENSDVFVEFFGRQLTIRSDYNGKAKAEVAAACELAGSQLLDAPGIKLSLRTKSQKQHWKRWLYFLKESEGLNRTVITHHHSADGYIESLARVSAMACVKCAAKAGGSA